MYINIRVYIHIINISIYTCIKTNQDAHECTHIDLHAQVSVHKHLHVYGHMYIYIYEYINIYIYHILKSCDAPPLSQHYATHPLEAEAGAWCQRIVFSGLASWRLWPAQRAQHWQLCR